MSAQFVRFNLPGQIQGIKSIYKSDPAGRYCPICDKPSSAFIPGGVVKKRANAKCPSCGALERHRLFWLYFVNSLMPRFITSRLRLLHVAPEAYISKRLKGIDGIDYVSGDLFMPDVDVKLDLTDIEFPDATFDIILCSHILEHIPDDATAMHEMFRVIRPGGFLLVMVPLYGATTYEDWSIATPEGRLAHFGQNDHVRKYGEDIEQRLALPGFEVAPRRYAKEVEPWLAEYAALVGNQIIYECHKPAVII